MVYPAASEMFPLRQVTTLSAMPSASGPLTLITEIAPVPGTVAGAQIVSSFRIYIFLLCPSLFCHSVPPFQLVRPGNRLKSWIGLPFLFSCPENSPFSRMSLPFLFSCPENSPFSRMSLPFLFSCPENSPFSRMSLPSRLVRPENSLFSRMGLPFPVLLSGKLSIFPDGFTIPGSPVRKTVHSPG